MILAALTLLTAQMHQESVMPPPPRGRLPRPVANAPIMRVNQNRVAAGALQPVGRRPDLTTHTIDG